MTEENSRLAWNEFGWKPHVWVEITVNSTPMLYLTDFLNRTFSGGNAKNHDFFGAKKMKAATVYLLYFNYTAMQGKFNKRPGAWLSPARHSTPLTLSADCDGRETVHRGAGN
jgi:hypothetical protein